MTDSVNPKVSIGENLFKDGVWNPTVQAVLAQYGLNFWPLTAIVGVITDAIYGKICVAIDVAAVAYINQAHKKTFDDAELKLQVMAVEYGPDSQEFKDEREKALAALASFVHMGA